MTTNNQEPICFRYDGSEDSKKALEWVNENRKVYHSGFKNKYYASDGEHYMSQPTTHRFVTPAEFLRIVTGESEWTPKYGEEVEVSDNKSLWYEGYYCCPNPNTKSQKEFPHIVCIKESKTGDSSSYRYIRPLRKSVREEINEIVKDWLLSENQYDLADVMLNHFNVTPKS